MRFFFLLALLSCRPKVFFTGFETIKINQSKENITQLLLQSQNEYDYQILPVSWTAYDNLHLPYKPDIIIALGETNHGIVRAEMYAYKESSKYPDNYNQYATEIEGPSVLKTNLFPKDIFINKDPGRYVCNRYYYELLQKSDIPAIFIHIPKNDYSLSIKNLAEKFLLY